MNRRAFLATAALTGTAGCLGSSSGDGTPTDDRPDDGYPPESADTPAEQSIDTSAFETTTVNGVDVPLAPIDVVHYWYRRRTARFADARGPRQYDRSHVYGAVLSPAPAGKEDDPVDEWPQGDRIVCYCGCPHHLSSLRAAHLLSEGYERVFVIDEGFWTWHDRGYPMAGTEITARPSVQVVRGRTAPTFAGQTAWARHEPTGQREAAPIDDAGEYTLELRFSDVAPTSIVTVETPGYRIAAPLADLTAEVVTPTAGT